MVVAIIALLISILLPSLHRARAIARSTVCLSRERQFGVAVHLYVTEYKGYIPRGGDQFAVHWIPLVSRQFGDRRHYEHVNQVPVEEMDYFHCPERTRTLPSPFLDYLVNTVNQDARMWTTPQLGDEISGPTRINVWSAPSEVLYIGEAALESTRYNDVMRTLRENHQKVINWKPGMAFYPSLDRMDFWLDVHLPGPAPKVASDDGRRLASYIHLNSWTNYLYVDGHAAPVKWLNDQRSKKEWLRMVGVRHWDEF